MCTVARPAARAWRGPSWRARISATPHPTSASTTNAGAKRALPTPRAAYALQRSRVERPDVLRQLGWANCHAVRNAITGTTAPAPSAAPRITRDGWWAKKSTERPMIRTSPGKMNEMPPTSAPRTPRNRQAL